MLQQASHEEDIMQAVSVYRTAVSSMKDKLFWSKQRALIFNRLGRIYDARRFSRYARDFYQKALQENPNIAVIHANTAFLLEEIAEQEVYRSGDIKPFQEVQTLYEKAMQLDAQDPFTAALQDGVPRRLQMALDRAQVEKLLSTPQACGQHERLDDSLASYPLTLAFHTTQRHGSFAPRAGEGEVLIQRLIEVLQKSGSVAVHDSAIADDGFAVRLLADYRIDRAPSDAFHKQVLHLTVMDTATGERRVEANWEWTHGELNGMAETLASHLMQQLSRAYPSRQPDAIVRGGLQP
jgi:tetratricopeptide (TPR) repeat protein